MSAYRTEYSNRDYQHNAALWLVLNAAERNGVPVWQPEMRREIRAALGLPEQSHAERRTDLAVFSRAVRVLGLERIRRNRRRGGPSPQTRQWLVGTTPTNVAIAAKFLAVADEPQEVWPL